MWCIQKITPEYRQRMYDVLDLYAQSYDRKQPVVCCDEKSKQLISDVREPIMGRPGRTLRYDYEYKRQGIRNIFVAATPKGGKHIIRVTRNRKKLDFANFIRELVDKNYRQADRVRVVLDNLNTHFESSFFENFSREEAKRILGKVEFHYTPKHASWLNMAEIEINMMDRECLPGRRIPDENQLSSELAAWEKKRNEAKKKITWRFTCKDADRKLGKHYIV